MGWGGLSTRGRRVVGGLLRCGRWGWGGDDWEGRRGAGWGVVRIGPGEGSSCCAVKVGRGMWGGKSVGWEYA